MGEKKITYSTNWMGPVNLQWYRDRGLTKIHPPKWSDLLQTEIKQEEITEHWAGGRIDIRGTESPFGDETGLPIMHQEDYNRLSEWLSSYRTEEVQHFKQILAAYYADGNPKIRFDREDYQ